MKTEDLRTLVAAACTRLRGRLWPNGLGFDLRGGYAIRYLERSGQWEATKPLRYAMRYGFSQTPEGALAAARPRRDGRLPDALQP